jgi:superfamily II DNA or RNA helicase
VAVTDELIEVDFGDTKLAFNLRDYQVAAKDATHEGWQMYSRQLLSMATGTGKSTIFAAIGADEWSRGGRTLILENRDALVRQTAKRIKDETGIDCEIEMADLHASITAPIVIASVPTLCRDRRLTGFPHDHFSLVVTDEAHHSLATSYAKILSYFHYGMESMVEGWVAPPDGTYQHKARILGVTATPELSSKRTLGEAYQTIAYNYSLINAVRDGWLVPPITKNIPLKIDIRGLRPGRTPNGSDFKLEDLSARLVPVLEALAEQICSIAANEKTIAFVPSVECARILAEAITRHGLNGIFVSGDCLDVDEKTEAYRRAGRGTVLCNCALYCEGADFPDTSCVVIARATKSTGFYRQMIGRGTRTLPGIVDGLSTPELRRAAIAASAKPTLLILDPLWVSDRIDLCDAYDLFTDKPEIKERMKKLGQPSEEAARQAERDMIKALEKEALKHARKQARVIDPLQWSVMVGEEALADFVPAENWEADAPTEGQISFLQKQGIDTSKIKYKGLAHKIIGRVVSRVNLGLATGRQLSLMRQLGLDEHTCATLTMKEASMAIDHAMAERKLQRATS